MYGCLSPTELHVCKHAAGHVYVIIKTLALFKIKEVFSELIFLLELLNKLIDTKQKLLPARINDNLKLHVYIIYTSVDPVLCYCATPFLN